MKNKEFPVNAKKGFLTMLVILLFPLCGCFVATRGVAVVDVPDCGETIQTKYRYYCIAKEDYDCWLQGEPAKAYSEALAKYGAEHVRSNYYKTLKEHSWVHTSFKKSMPEIFSDDGIPIIVDESISDGGGGLGWWFLLGSMTLDTVAPMHYWSTRKASYNFWLAGLPAKQTRREIHVSSCGSFAQSFILPWALLFFHDTPKRENYPGFEKGKMFSDQNHYECFIWVLSGKSPEDYLVAYGRHVPLKVSCYGIAYRLKEMEEAGIITDENVRLGAELHARRRNAKRQVQQRKTAEKAALQPTAQPARQANPPSPSASPSPQPKSPPKPKYTLESLEWNDQKDFECEFSMILNDNFTMKDYSVVMQDIIVFLRDAYIQMHPGTNANSLVVDARPSLKNGRIIGHAAVLSLAVERLEYDAATRRGKLAVRFNPGQVEEARVYIQRNIETLVRDKNILLTTGERPPEGQYRSLGEKWNGDILEIEFETE